MLHSITGDEIIGYVTRITGITVHRKDCENCKAMIAKDPSREIIVTWDPKMIETKMNKYSFTFQL